MVGSFVAIYIMSPEETHEVVTAGGLVENEPPADRKEPLPPLTPKGSHIRIKKHYNYELLKLIISYNIPSIWRGVGFD